MQAQLRRFKFAIGFLALAVFCTLSVQNALATPKFSDYPAGEMYTGEPAKIDTTAAPESWDAVNPVFKRFIEEDMAKGPNFAGEYFLSMVPCGTGCEVIFVVSLKNGRIFTLPKPITNGAIYQTESMLVIVEEDEKLNSARSYYLFDNAKFTELRGN